MEGTHKTTEKVAEALEPAGIHVSANTVARQLKQMKYSLRVNLKKKATGEPSTGNLYTRFDEGRCPLRAPATLLNFVVKNSDTSRGKEF